MLITKEFSIEEVDHIISSLDLFSRILIGQYDEIIDYIDWNVGKSSWYYPNRHYLASYLFEVRNKFIPSLNNDSRASLGIWQPETPKVAIKAYDIKQILRYQLAWHRNPKGDYTVNFDTPFIHGEYNSSYDERKEIGDEVMYYHDTHFGYIKTNVMWYEPCVISNFGEKTCKIKMVKEAEKIIDLALEIENFIADISVLNVFKKLYPNIDINSYMYQISTAEHLLKSEEMKKYFEKKNQ